MNRSALLPAVAWIASLPAAGFAEGAATRPIELAGGALTVAAPGAWQSVTPGSGILEHELSVPAPEGIEAPAARLTMMAAGGSVEQNVARWVGQFEGTEGGADRSGAVIERLKVAGMPVTIVEQQGTYLESAGGPFGPKTPRLGYALRGAIVETGAGTSYFLKLIGPAEAVEPATDDFRQMVESVRPR